MDQVVLKGMALVTEDSYGVKFDGSPDAPAEREASPKRSENSYVRP